MYYKLLYMIMSIKQNKNGNKNVYIKKHATLERLVKEKHFKYLIDTYCMLFLAC